MNKILSYVRRCVEDYDMIQAGDRVAVGVSGGKDSLTLLVALARLREFYPKPLPWRPTPWIWAMWTGERGWTSPGVEALCRELDVPFTLLHSEIHHIIFDLRKEKNPLLHVRQDAPGRPPQRPEGARHHQDRPGPPL